MKKTSKFTSISRFLKNRFLFLLMIGGFQQAIFAQGGPPFDPRYTGGALIWTGPTNGDNLIFGPASEPPQLTPFCVVADNCNPTPNFIPVWRQVGLNLQECPSPLIVRRDVYTCNRVFRDNIFNNNAWSSSPITNTNGYNPSCAGCDIGFVGVNVNAAEEQLHVAGNIRIDQGKLLGDIASENIYGKMTDPDMMPFSGDETYSNIVVHSETDFQSGLTGTNANLNSMNVWGTAGITTLNATTGTVTNLTASHLTALGGITNNGDMAVKGRLRVKNASGTNVFSVDQTGNIRSRRSTVDLLPIPDYVFGKDYKLMSLSEVEAFIQKNKHLPNIKSEEEYKADGGIDLGELNVKLLEKVEELTLHLIEQNKKIQELEDQMKKIKH